MKLLNKFVKRNNILLLFLFFFSFSFVSAESSLSHISAFFCPEMYRPLQHAYFVVEAGKAYPLCLEFSNDASTSVLVNFSFVDGQRTADSEHSKACGSASASFSEYIGLSKETLSLPAHSTVRLTGDFHFPPGYSGHIQGCLVYMPVEKTRQEGMFSVIMRKASFFEGDVVGVIKRDLRIGSGITSFSALKNILTLSFPVVNSGTFSETLILSGSIRNSLGYERALFIEKKIGYGTSSVLDYQILDIPFYQGKYTFLGSVFSRADLDNFITPILPRDKDLLSFPFSFSVFLMPWKMILGTLFFLLLLFVFLRRRSR